MKPVKRTRKLWTDSEIWRLIAFYPDQTNRTVARKFKRPYSSIVGMATTLGLRKTREHLSRMPHRAMIKAGEAYRFPKGHVPMNKGVKIWWDPGRSVETRFKKGNVSKRWDPEIYQVGALRINADGYVDMKVKEGLRAWRQLHYILWEDAHGPVPKGHVLRFKDRDPLNVEIENLELIHRRDNMLRNSIHNLPPALKSSIQLLGQLTRRINEKRDHRSA